MSDSLLFFFGVGISTLTAAALCIAAIDRDLKRCEDAAAEREENSRSAREATPEQPQAAPALVTVRHSGS
jgi:hypothetical protein